MLLKDLLNYSSFQNHPKCLPTVNSAAYVFPASFIMCWFKLLPLTKISVDISLSSFFIFYFFLFLKIVVYVWVHVCRCNSAFQYTLTAKHVKLLNSLCVTMILNVILDIDRLKQRENFEIHIKLLQLD